MPSTVLPAEQDAGQEHLIEPARGWVPIRPAELWAYRELLYLLVWRSVKVRYKQTALGVAWAVIQPLATTVVFTVVFDRIAAVPVQGPYPLFALAALLPWQLFAFALSESTNSVVQNQALVTKVYFPRLIMPLASVAVGLVDFSVALLLAAGLMIYYGVTPSLALVTLPFWTLLAVAVAFSVGVWLSALNVRYRDVRHTLPFVTQILLLATPVAYPLSAVDPAWQWLYLLNPMAGVVTGFRWALVGATPMSVPALASTLAVTTVVGLSGLLYFKRTERTFADLV
jgi:lipopolysaccharide transport system permease protein